MSHHEPDTEHLRARAIKILAALKRVEREDLPLFIEFSGTPKSGKSTCIAIIHHFFRRLDYTVLAPAEGASKRTPYHLRDDLVAFNTWSASYALRQILEGVYHSDLFHLSILDRGLFDALVWFHFFTDRDTLAREDCETIHQFLLLAPWRKRIDAETISLFSGGFLDVPSLGPLIQRMDPWSRILYEEYLVPVARRTA